MRTILLTFSLLTSSILFAQTFKTGYIIKNNGDTVRGYIKEDAEEKLAQSISFKDQANAITVLTVQDVKEFEFEGEGTFRQVHYVDPLDSLKSKVQFAKFLLEGTYRLFSFRRKDDLNFIVVNTDTSYLLYDDMKSEFGQIFEKGNYQSMLAFFSRECPKVNVKAENVNFTEESLLAFFVSLEKCIGKGNDAVVHYSKSKAQKNIILSAGGLAWDKRTEIAVQALGQFVLPSVNSKVSLLTGLVYLRSTHENTTTYTLSKITNEYANQVMEIPLLLRYDILQKAIQPYVYGGAGAAIKKDEQTSTQVSLISSATEDYRKTEDSKFTVTVVVGGGLNVRITKGCFINVDWRYDLESRLPVVGLAYKIALGKKQ